ncbi:ferrous iron transporter B [Orrella sp. NBD-18]|uniref:Ferrous iron transport protein B n=1 Tax=Sheuella amnicola TaxID=2707330 RepID=A0A6B2QXG3_9BURK|nr:ferrous iron transporter B [Sheuella amnicola]NDY82682.1 ferrous iron transporter B [Sheuella amnicola]HBI83109.1 ferrous iron transporter B [Alcaligenaceae bacterium]
MVEQARVYFHPTGPLVALVGNPNCGKTALFNRLTGSRQKVANYAGVTVERKEGRLITPKGKTLRILDLPGTYSLYPRSLDERVTCDVLAGRAVGEKKPDLVVCVVDATNLRRSLRLVLAVQRLNIPFIVTLNMSDEARARGIHIDEIALSEELGVPVVSTVAVEAQGDEPLRIALDQPDSWKHIVDPHIADETEPDLIHMDHERVQSILKHLDLDHVTPDLKSEKLDRVLLHPVAGPAILVVLLFVIFQAMFSMAAIPMEWIKEGTLWLSQQIVDTMPDSWIRSLIVDGVIAGVGAVVVFLPQILILFGFILALEESGYLPRAAYLLDRLMGTVGLSGRSFIPLLSSFACAIPGIIATRTIPNSRDRTVTMLIAPLMTCSARLPVYALLIAAFIPQRIVWGALELQGIVMFSLYVAGIVGAMAVAWALKRFTESGRQIRPLMMELPTYRIPNPLNIAIGLWQRARLFMKRVGGVIMVMTLALWFLASFPGAPEGATGAAIEYSFAGMMGKALAVVLAPIGFNWQISIALIPGMAAREVAISALGTVYALSATGPAGADTLAPVIAQQWGLPTALALLAWYVFAPQCLSTLATIKRESGGWKIPLISVTYLFALAYLAAFVTYRISLALL